jgi:hypothetical protein
MGSPVPIYEEQSAGMTMSPRPKKALTVTGTEAPVTVG